VDPIPDDGSVGVARVLRVRLLVLVRGYANWARHVEPYNSRLAIWAFRRLSMARLIAALLVPALGTINRENWVTRRFIATMAVLLLLILVPNY